MQHPPETDDRLRRLEAVVEELQHAVRRLEGAALPSTNAQPPFTPSPVHPSPQGHPVTPVTPSPRLTVPDLGQGEFWLSKVGIGLLLLGVAFLFKYSIDQGWITPLVRVAAGAAVGTVLTFSGVRLRHRQRNLSLVLLGGGIATFYMVGFAASQLYGLVSEGGSFAAMVGVTALAYWLSLREEEAVLTVVGTLGALGTPFLLYPRTGDLAWLSAYVAVIALWNGVVYAHRRWPAALGAAALGTWLALLSGMVVKERLGPVAGVDRWALQGAVVLAWAVFGVLPSLLLVRGGEEDDEEIAYPGVLVLASPLLALGITYALWPVSEEAWGTGTAAAGALYLAAAWGMRRRHAGMASVLTLAGAVLLAVGVFTAAHGNPRWLLLAGVALALHLLARRGLGAVAELCGHALFGFLGLVFLVGVRNPVEALLSPAGSASAAPLLGAGSLTDLALIAAGLAASFLLEGRARVVYRLGVHAAVLQWSWREFSGLPGGEGIVSVLWGIYGVALLVVATLRGYPLLQVVARGTLLLLVAKMFLIDLRALEALWRILLFSGLGGLFLLLSYLVGRRREPSRAA